MALTQPQIDTAIAGKTVEVKILEDTVAGGKSVFKGNILKILYEDYLTLKAWGKAELHILEGKTEANVAVAQATVGSDVAKLNDAVQKELDQKQPTPVPEKSDKTKPVAGSKQTFTQPAK